MFFWNTLEIGLLDDAASRWLCGEHVFAATQDQQDGDEGHSASAEHSSDTRQQHKNVSLFCNRELKTHCCKNHS
jgi:hypothetical protein